MNINENYRENAMHVVRETHWELKEAIKALTY